MKDVFYLQNWMMAKRDIEIQAGFEPGSSEFRSDARTNWATEALAIGVFRHVKIRHLVNTFAWFSSFLYKEWQSPSNALLVQYEPHPLNATPVVRIMMREELAKSGGRKDSLNLLCHLLGPTRGECDCGRGGCNCMRAPLSNEPYFSAARQPCGCDPDNCYAQVEVVS